MSVPSQMKSLRTQPGPKVGVETVPVPQPKANEVLVKVKAVTLNPTDWKSSQLFELPGNGIGCDAYGEIVKVGSDLPVPLKVGQNVAFFEMGSFDSPEKGTFSEYATTSAATAIVVPDGFDGSEASSFGIGGLTAVQTLFARLGLKSIPSALSSPPSLSSSSPQVLIWAASTSVGQFATQLGRLAGYHVIVTASEKNWPYLKELGAADAFDYKDPETPSKIHAKYPDLSLALDCFSEQGSSVSTSKSLSDKGGRVVNILPTEKQAKEARPDVEFIASLVYTVLGRTVKFGKWPTSEEEIKKDHQFIQPWTAGEKSILHNLMAKGLIKGNRIRKQSGGIEDIEKGMQELKDGKVSLEKLAYQIA